jgi:hypothetical protein
MADPIVNPGAAVDPNTGLPAQPLTRAATAAMQVGQYVDAWQDNPAGAPPVRTWRDPSQLQGEQGQYLSAWYDQPVAAPAHPTVAPQGESVAPVTQPSTQDASNGDAPIDRQVSRSVQPDDYAIATANYNTNGY